MPTMDAKILLVDDSTVLRKLALITLGGIGGYRFAEAADARYALELATAERFDVVITDHYMPGMDGTEFVRQLRKRPEYTDTPIVMLTSEVDAFIEEEARAAGVDAFVRKPFEPGVMRTVLKELLGRRKDAPVTQQPSVDAQTLLDSMPYPAMVLDGSHNVLMGNAAFWHQTNTGIGDCGVVCAIAMHKHGEPHNCPLTESAMTGEPVECRVVEPGSGALQVSVYPMAQSDENGHPLYLHLARPEV